MNKNELLNAINQNSFDGNTEQIIEILNELFDSGEYKAHLNLVFNAISITQMYGFLSYLTEEERVFFLQCDRLRSDTYRGKRIDFLNSGQLSLLLDFDSTPKAFLSAPTSFGKTSLLIEYIISNYIDLKNILFIVPTNSLLEELFTKIILCNKRYNMGYSVSTQPYFRKEVNNFLIVTPERFLLLYEENNINKFDLIVLDETYKIVDSRNERVSDFIDSRAVRFRKVADIIGQTQKKLFLLSPFTYTLTKSMEKFLRKYDIAKIDRKIEYVKRKIYKIDNTISFREHFKLKVVGYSSASVAKKTNLLLRVLEEQKNIVYVSQYAKAYDIVDELDWTRPVRGSERYFKFLTHLQNNYTVDDKFEWKIISALKKGVGIYISPLPRYIKREIIKLYEENVLGTLIVTTSFTEGVNTNASNLIFTSLVNGPTTNKLSDIDILNVAGRAGRFAQKSIGNVYCISSEVYDKVVQLQNSAEIKLENYNYKFNNSFPRIDYELDMIDNEYLNEDEMRIKANIALEMEELGLTPQDFHLSLNVSNKWKIALYKFLLARSSAEIEQAYKASSNLLSVQPNERIDSLNIIFELMRQSFDAADIDGFPCQPYDIRAFDSKNRFVWGRLYRIYCAGSISNVISHNIAFVRRRFEDIIAENHLQNCKHISQVQYYFDKERVGWILRYYHSDLKINFNAFFSETFKFISNIIQYKVPFYTSYFVSILKLFLSKSGNYRNFDINKLDVKKISLLFEDGSVYDDYSKMIDYGLSNDLIMKLHDSHISLQQLKNGDYTKTIFDDYEQILIGEFINIL